MFYMNFIIILFLSPIIQMESILITKFSFPHSAAPLPPSTTRSWHRCPRASYPGHRSRGSWTPIIDYVDFNFSWKKQINKTSCAIERNFLFKKRCQEADQWAFYFTMFKTYTQNQAGVYARPQRCLIDRPTQSNALGNSLVASEILTSDTPGIPQGTPCWFYVPPVGWYGGVMGVKIYLLEKCEFPFY